MEEETQTGQRRKALIRTTTLIVIHTGFFPKYFLVHFMGKTERFKYSEEDAHFPLSKNFRIPLPPGTYNPLDSNNIWTDRKNLVAGKGKCWKK